MYSKIISAAVIVSFLASSIAHAENSFATSLSSTAIEDRSLITLSLMTGPIGDPVDNTHTFSGNLFHPRFPQTPVSVSVEAVDPSPPMMARFGAIKVLDRFETSSKIGGAQVNRTVYQLVGEDNNIVTVGITDDPFVGIIIFSIAASAIAYCGTMMIYNMMQECKGLNGGIDLSIAGSASCSAECVK